MAEVLTERFRHWFEYEKDVHRKTLASLQAVPSENQSSPDFRKALDLFGHILAARLMWLYRFGLGNEPVELFPKISGLAAIPRLLELVETDWTTYLSGLTDAELSRVFEYTSYEGKRFSNSIEEILTQLFGHSWYHRGQIAQLVRRLAAEPAITDFVYWSRRPL